MGNRQKGRLVKTGSFIGDSGSFFFFKMNEKKMFCVLMRIIQ